MRNRKATRGKDWQYMRIRPAAFVWPSRLLHFGLRDLIEAVQMRQVFPIVNVCPSSRKAVVGGRVTRRKSSKLLSNVRHLVSMN